MPITVQVLKNLCPYGKSGLIDEVVDNFNKLAPNFSVTSDLRVCHFFAQAAVETDWFKTLQEYASGAEYEGRSDLGNVNPGDGVRYKGRGIFQTTGRYNYSDTGKKMGIDLLSDPQKLLEPKNAVLSALIYWRDHKIESMADADDVYAVTRAINGGYNGINERRRALDVLKATLNKKFISAGSSLADVERVQIMLKVLGYKVGVADGVYGPATSQAVRLFQSDNSLPQTGLVEDTTLAQIEKKFNEKKKE